MNMTTHTLKVSDALLFEILCALEARIRELNSRFPEPTQEALVATVAAREMAWEAKAKVTGAQP